jgi:predicted ABC-type transport system involved in lysophospholipase L1 biosynthesis ATPase subunit
MMPVPPLIEVTGVQKSYAGLRPLRIKRLVIEAHERVALSGFDAAAAEVFINLVTGAAVPDEGEVRVAGQNTRDIATDTEWLSSLDRFGIVTERAVLLESMSAAANLALPLTLAIDPMPPEVTSRVRSIASEVGLPDERLSAAASSLSTEERLRIHLGRALAVNPAVLLLEHPTARLPPGGPEAIGLTLQQVAAARRLAWVALTEDDGFARAAGGRRLRLKPATGELVEEGGFWRRLAPGRK